MSQRNRYLCILLLTLVQWTPGDDVFAQRSRATAHPWLATAPGEYVRLIQAGEVSIEEDDERLQKEKKQALTFFTLIIDYRYTMQYHFVESGPDQQAIRVTVRYKKPTSKLTHKIVIPSNFKPVSPWTNSLLMHEMDHVAMSTDPRLEKWIENYFAVERSWDFTWNQSTKPTDSQIQTKIVEKSQELTFDVERWIQFLYDHLDSESVHGTRDIANRTNFFALLYAPETVAKCKIASFLSLSPEQIRSGGKMPNRKLEAHFRIKID